MSKTRRSLNNDLNHLVKMVCIHDAVLALLSDVVALTVTSLLFSTVCSEGVLLHPLKQHYKNPALGFYTFLKKTADS